MENTDFRRVLLNNSYLFHFNDLSFIFRVKPSTHYKYTLPFWFFSPPKIPYLKDWGPHLCIFQKRDVITNWFYEGLKITEVMRLAGHSKYDTTLKYYLAVKDDLVDKARQAVRHRVSREMLERCLGREE